MYRTFRAMLGIATAFGLLAFAVVTAQAAGIGDPHFIGSATSDSLSSTGNLVVVFKEAGLASGATEQIQVTATATADSFCVNGGSHNPAASNKRTSVSQVTASGFFTANINGNVTGTLTAPLPQMPSDFSCPPGQTAELGSVSYTNVVITDLTSNNGSSSSLSDQSTGCLLTNVTFKHGVSCVG